MLPLLYLLSSPHHPYAEPKATTSSLPSICSIHNLPLLLFLFIHSNPLYHPFFKLISFKYLLYPFFYITTPFSYCISHSFISIPLLHVKRVLLLQSPSPFLLLDFHTLFFFISLLPHFVIAYRQISSSSYSASFFAHPFHLYTQYNSIYTQSLSDYPLHRSIPNMPFDETPEFQIDYLRTALSFPPFLLCNQHIVSSSS